MAENSAISWTDHTFNPWIGCTKVSPACDGCYAEALMGQGGRFARAEWGGPGKGVGTRVRTSPANWREPLKWNWDAAKAKGEVFVFCASLADVFDNAVPPEWRRDLFDLIRATPRLTWLLLTKRPQMIIKLFRETILDVGDADYPGAYWPDNAAIGCTVVTQAEADRDIPILLEAKGRLNPAFAFVSMEPLLEHVDITPFLFIYTHQDMKILRSSPPDQEPTLPWRDPRRTPLAKIDTHRLDWVIAGGETHQGDHEARPSHPDWFRSLRDQCAAAVVPFHFKQWGEWTPGENVTGVNGIVSAAWADGEAGWTYGAENLGGTDGHIDDEPDLYRIGKIRAGRRLDGLIHNARAEVIR